MPSPLDSILDIVKRKVSERAGASQSGVFPSGGILGQLGQILAQRARPAGHAGRDVRPASEDPYGDPADRVDKGRVRPASEDPYGDPADQEKR